MKNLVFILFAMLIPLLATSQVNRIHTWEFSYTEPGGGVTQSTLDDTASAIRGDFPAGGGGVTDITYANLVTAIGAGTLTAGGWYRITDFATVHYFTDGTTTIDTAINTGVVEPLIVLATSDTSIANQAFSSQYPNDQIFYDWNPANWTDDVSFADTGVIVTGWKGVITFREDTYLNLRTGYDFRNIKYRNTGDYYTFGSGCHDISIEPLFQDTGNNLSTRLNNIIFDDSCYSFQFSYQCHDMYFGTKCSMMTFASSCGNMIFGQTCKNLTFGNFCTDFIVPDNVINIRIEDGITDINLLGISQPLFLCNKVIMTVWSDMFQMVCGIVLVYKQEDIGSYKDVYVSLRVIF